MRNQRLLLAALALTLSGCALIPGHVNTPPEVRTRCLASCEAFEDAAARNVCALACPPATPTDLPTTPTAPVVATATVTPTSAPTAPATETAVPVGGDVCTGPDDSRGPFADQVEKAERDWLDAHADRWTHAGLGGTEFRLQQVWVDPFQFDAVRALRAAGLDAVVEANGSGAPNGSIAVAIRGDASFHAGYALVVGGSWDVRFPSRGGGYRGRCEPRGFTPQGQAAVTPSPTATPTASLSVACPPLLTVTAAVKGGTGRWPGDAPGKWCLTIDMTGRFDVDGSGRGQPCNVEHPNCGVAGTIYPFAGEACEPDPESLLVTYSSAQGPAGTFTGYSGRVCGPEGSPYSVKVTLAPGAVDKAGRPIPKALFAPFLLQGAI